MKARAFPFLALGALLLIGGALVYAARGRPEAAAQTVKITQLEGRGSAEGMSVETCDMLVIFGSFASGIDHRLLERVSAEVERARGFESAVLGSWGREGELTLCLKAAPAEADRLYEQFKALLASSRQENGWTKLERKDFPIFPP